MMMVTTSTDPRDLAKAKQFAPYLKGFKEKPLTEEQMVDIWNQYVDN